MQITRLRTERITADGSTLERITWSAHGREFVSELRDGDPTVRLYDPGGQWLTQMSNAPDHVWSGQVLVAGVAHGGN